MVATLTSTSPDIDKCPRCGDRLSVERISTWHGKPIGSMTRGQLIDALDWCVEELRKHNGDYHHISIQKAKNATD